MVSEKKELQLEVLYKGVEFVVFRVAVQTHFGESFGENSDMFKAKNGVALISSGKGGMSFLSGDKKSFWVRPNCPVCQLHSGDWTIEARREDFEAIEEAVKEYNAYVKEWTPQPGDWYYFLSIRLLGGDHAVSRTRNYTYPEDRTRIKEGNYFRTKEAAEKALASIKPELEVLSVKLREFRR